MKPLAFSTGFILSLWQIAVQKSLVGVIKRGLRIVIVAA
jgi:hypothetical protein